MLTVLYPCAFSHIKEVDEDYQFEYNVANSFADFQILFYDYDEFVATKKLNLYPRDFECGICVYRGWMLKSEQYELLYHALSQKGITLINTPKEYQACHEFPYSYPKLKDFTPSILCYPKEAVLWEEVKRHFPSFFIKDYVKSLKGTHFPAFFTSSYSDEELESALRDFIEMRGPLFTGKIVIKQFVNLAKREGKTNEYRAFYLDGTLLTLTRNSDQDISCEVVPQKFLNVIPKLDSRFYTIDFAQLEDGGWIVIETGDGQVSGLPPSQDVKGFYTALNQNINSIL